MSQPAYQLVVFGATSFVGQILVQYLYTRHGANGALRWAIAGRSAQKLERLRDSLGEGAAGLPVILANADDAASLLALCEQTQVVASTVGPYALYGSELVRVCAQRGTDYCDLTGEVQWIARMIAAHGETAQRSGARIVHCCGFDSIPSDLGVHFLQQASWQRFGEPCTRVKLRIKAMRGGLSGGTAASLMNVVRESARNPQVRALMSNPYAVVPDDGRPRVRQHNVRFAEFDADAGGWAAPFVMAGINTRIVHRSNALSGYRYGEAFRYDEAMMTGTGIKGRASAMGVAIGLNVFVAAAAVPPTRWLLEKYVIPQPGEGPGAAAQAKGFYDFRFFGTTDSGKTLQVKVTGDRDPGYGSTGKMLGEAAVCLASEISKRDKPGGFWTPATVMGDALLQRLQAHAGLSFQILN